MKDKPMPGSWPDDHALETLLSDRKRQVLPLEGLQAASVLLPFFTKDTHPHLLLTRRTEGVSTHKGQICFPGGRKHPKDNDLLATALRESQEEVGLSPQDARVLGALDDVLTLNTYRITPFLARIPYPYQFKRQEREVAEILEIPLGRFQEPARLRTELFTLPDGQTRTVYFYDMESVVVWGATARMIKNWLDLLLPADVDKPCP
jgi:8-oxo-dGTP pyrophosphatase MutT (NUDIX family)